MNRMVTVGAGFIGSHIIDALVAHGSAVTVFDNLSSGKRQNLGAGVTIAVGNVPNPKAVAAALTPCTDAVFHLAAQIDVHRAITVPATDIEVMFEEPSTYCGNKRRRVRERCNVYPWTLGVQRTGPATTPEDGLAQTLERVKTTIRQDQPC